MSSEKIDADARNRASTGESATHGTNIQRSGGSHVLATSVPQKPAFAQDADAKDVNDKEVREARLLGMVRFGREYRLLDFRVEVNEDGELVKVLDSSPHTPEIRSLVIEQYQLQSYESLMEASK